MEIANYLDSTYLKTPSESGLSDSETLEKVKELALEAIEYNIKAVMIRPNYVKQIAQLKHERNGKFLIGTVIGFPLGKESIGEKLAEAQKAINNGAEELDFVLNYEKLLENNLNYIKDELLSCTEYILKKRLCIKWIIETAALNNAQIQQISEIIKEIVLSNFPDETELVFVKSSTGYFKAEHSGATPESIQIMIENASPLPIKASGGVKTKDDALKYINQGVKRIGTSSAVKIIKGTVD